VSDKIMNQENYSIIKKARDLADDAFSIWEGLEFDSSITGMLAVTTEGDLWCDMYKDVEIESGECIKLYGEMGLKDRFLEFLHGAGMDDREKREYIDGYLIGVNKLRDMMLKELKELKTKQ